MKFQKDLKFLKKSNQPFSLASNLVGLFFLPLKQTSNSKGFSLISVIVASTVALILVGGMTQMLGNISWQIKQFENHRKRVLFYETVAKILKTGCDKTFKPHTSDIISGNKIQFTQLRVENETNDGQLVLDLEAEKDRLRSIYAIFGDNSFELTCADDLDGNGVIEENACDCSTETTDCKRRWDLKFGTQNESEDVVYDKGFNFELLIKISGSNLQCNYQSVAQESSASHVYALHSQTTTPPDCPEGFNSLWTGYSLAKGSYDDAGGNRFFYWGGSVEGMEKSGSCMPHYTIDSRFECGSRTSCGRHRHSKWTWLTVNNNASTSENTISRCRVCEGNKKLIVKHSQSISLPAVPNGWERVWSGYSYAGGSHRVSSVLAGFSDLTSCLRKFVNRPIKICRDNQCWNNHLNSGSWLPNRSGGVSRCSVFMKSD